MFAPEPFHPARPGVFRPCRADPAGLTGPTRGQFQGPLVRRTSYGFYLPASVERTTEQRIVEAAQVNSGKPLVVTGWANLCWRGGRWFTGLAADGSELPVDVLVNTRDLRPRTGVRWSGEGIGEHHREKVDGLLLADVRSAVSFLMRRASSKAAAVCAFDMAAYDDLVSIQEMQDFLRGQSSWTGVPQARDALAWASESAWSPPETDLRLVWGPLTGRSMPLANVPIFDRVTGEHIATPDVLDPVAGVGGEYEGGVHLQREVRDRDVRREGVLRRYGLESVTMLADDRHDPRHFLARLADGYGRAGLLAGERRWTTDPPRWWTATTTVAQRRRLTPDQRRRFLRYRH